MYTGFLIFFSLYFSISQVDEKPSERNKYPIDFKSLIEIPIRRKILFFFSHRARMRERERERAVKAMQFSTESQIDTNGRL